MDIQVKPVKADPITVEVVRSYMQSTARQMRNVLVRGSFNPIIYEMMDFSVGVFNRDAELIAEGPGIPSFLGTLTFAIRLIMNYVGEDNVEEGDVLLSTYPYMIGSHPQDATIIQPIFVDGRIFGYTAAKAHWVDIGAKDIYGIDTTDVFQEGIKFYGVKLVRKGKLNAELIEIIRANSRLPEPVIGDVTAQVAACDAGARQVLRLVEKYGAAVVDSAVTQLLDHGEAIARAQIAALPDGEWFAESSLDNNGIESESVPIRVRIEIKASDIVVDTSGSAGTQVGPINCPYGRTASVVRLVVKMLIAPDYPANEGFFRPITVVSPPGSIFNPRPPAPTFLYGWPSRPLGDAIFKAFCEIAPERSVARSGGCMAAFLFSWRDPVDGSYAAGAANEAMGEGAGLDCDGESAVINFTLGESSNVPVEIVEERYPVHVECYELWQDSAGAGKFRGGLGVRRRWRFLQDVSLITVVDQTRNPAWGIDGGGYARANLLVLRPGEPGERRVGKVSGYKMAKGDVAELTTGGGGGWGDARERPTEAVLEDVRNGYISPAAAERDYGVRIGGERPADYRVLGRS